MRTNEVAAAGGIRLSVEGVDGDTVSWKPIDAFTIDAIVKKAGSVVNATRLVVSRDGKALTITENGTGPKGRATHGVRIYKMR